MSRISLDRGRHSIDDVGSVSSSSSLPDTDGHRISGSATPRSAHSTTSLEEMNAGPTRQYSIRRENGGPVIHQSQRPPSPHSSTSESGSSNKAPPRRDRPPPVQERTSSLTPTLSRRTSQPLCKSLDFVFILVLLEYNIFSPIFVLFLHTTPFWIKLKRTSDHPTPFQGDCLTP